MADRATLNIIFIAILGVLLGAAFVTGAFVGFKIRRPPEPTKPQVDTVWLPDTVKLTDSNPIGSVTVPLPIVRPSVPDTAGLAHNLADSANSFAKNAKDTVTVRDSVFVEVPIEEKTYEGEHYRAVIQGYQPKLVSIDLLLPDIVPPEPAFKPGWHFTIGLQMGYGFTPDGWHPYVGVGGTLGWTF